MDMETVEIWLDTPSFKEGNEENRVMELCNESEKNGQKLDFGAGGMQLIGYNLFLFFF